MTDNAPNLNATLVERDGVKMTVADRNDELIQIEIQVDARTIKRASKKLKKMGENFKDQDLIWKIVNECMKIATEEHVSESLWGPHLKGILPKLVHEKPIEFTLSIDTLSLEWPAWSEITIQRPVREIDEAMLESEMYQQRLIAGERHPRDGTPQPEDIITCNLQIDMADVPEQSQRFEDLEIQVPQPGCPTIISGIQVPQFEDHLIHAVPGQTFTIVIDMPENHEMHGQQGTLEFECLRVEQLTPASIEQVVELYGSPNEKVLREQIRYSLEAKYKRDQLSAMINQFFDTLSERLGFVVPEHVIQGIANKMTLQFVQQAKTAGHSRKETDSMIQQHRDGWEAEAESVARKNAIIQKLSTHLKAPFNELMFKTEINSIAVDLGRRPEELRNELIAQGKITGIVSMCKKKSCFEILKDELTIVDIPADEWEAIQEADQT